MSISKLPLDVRNHIINLSGNIHAAEVCKEWHDIVQKNIPVIVRNNCPETLKQKTIKHCGKEDILFLSHPFSSLLKKAYEEAKNINDEESRLILKEEEMALSVKVLRLEEIIQKKKDEDEATELEALKRQINPDVCNLTDNNLIYVSQVCKLDGIKELSLNKNRLRDLPNGITKLTNLEKLELESNEFHKIPSEVFKLIHLKELNFAINNLETIPVDICKLTELKELNVAINDFLYVPMHVMETFYSDELHEPSVLCFNLDKDIKHLETYRDPEFEICPRLVELLVEFNNENKLTEFENKTAELLNTIRGFHPSWHLILSASNEQEKLKIFGPLLKRMQELQVLQNNFLSASNEQDKLETLKKIQNFYQGDGELQRQQVIEEIYFLMKSCPNSLLAQIIEEKVGLEAFLFHPLDTEMKKMLSGIDLLRDGQVVWEKLKNENTKNKKQHAEMQEKLEAANAENAFLRETIHRQDTTIRRLDTIREQDKENYDSSLKDFAEENEGLKMENESFKMKIEKLEEEFDQKEVFQKRKDAFLEKAIEKGVFKSMKEINNWLKKEPSEALWMLIKRAFPEMKEILLEIESSIQ